jgi:hypothetical protein
MVTIMLDWKTPEICDGEWIRPIVNTAGAMGSDLSFANIYLLRDKYNIRISQFENFLIRKYHGKGTRKGYTFPVGSGDLEAALREIELDARSKNERLIFTFVTPKQREKLESLYPERFDYIEDEGDYDYIYGRNELATLAGKSYHKKKNHVSKFTRQYPEFRYEELTSNNADDAAKVEEGWYGDHVQTEDDSQRLEYKSIREALHYFDELKLSGGIIYVGDTAVAMTIGSQISDGVVDVHFEKAIGEYADNGGYAAINNLFAKSCEDAMWLNREEDINIEGLRKAKQSYHPQIMLKKCCAVERG